jgi:hypothetical protein
MSEQYLPQQSGNILTSPEEYYRNQKKTLENRLEDVAIDEESIVNTSSKKFVRDKVMGFFKITDVVNTFLNWNDAVDADLRRAKKEFLLQEVINELEQRGKEVNQLKSFISDPIGNTLYNKIARILENFPPDEQLTVHLAGAIGYILETDFVSLFESHKYAISQIEQLTPQALTILADHVNWPAFNLGVTVAHGGVINSEWLPEFTNAYCRVKSVSDSNICERIGHSIGLLKTNSYMIAKTQDGGKPKCFLTPLGSNILPYISQRNK